MARFYVDYSFHARSGRAVEADSLEDARALVETEIEDDGIELEPDEIDGVSFEVREMHPVTRDGREMWTTHIQTKDVRGHQSALKTVPLFAGEGK